MVEKGCSGVGSWCWLWQAGGFEEPVWCLQESPTQQQHHSSVADRRGDVSFPQVHDSLLSCVSVFLSSPIFF